MLNGDTNFRFHVFLLAILQIIPLSSNLICMPNKKVFLLLLIGICRFCTPIMSHHNSPSHSQVRRRRTLADINVPSPISTPTTPDSTHDSYASSTGLDEFAADRSPLSPRLSLRAALEDRGKPPRGRALDRTPPNEVRNKRRKKIRITEFSQDNMSPQIYVSRRKRWVSVFLVWLAIVAAIVVVVWLRLARLAEQKDEVQPGNVADYRPSVDYIDTDGSDAWQKVNVDDVFGQPDRGPFRGQ